MATFYLDMQCTKKNTILYDGSAQLRGKDGQCSNADDDTRRFYAAQICGSTPCFPSIYVESPCLTLSPSASPTYPPALLAICPTQTPTLVPVTATPAYPSSDGTACSFDIVFYRQTTSCKGVALQSFVDVKFDTCLHDYLTGDSMKWTRGWGVVSAIYYDDADCRMINLGRYYQGVFTISDGQCSERNLIDSRLFRDYGGVQYPLSISVVPCAAVRIPPVIDSDCDLVVTYYQEVGSQCSGLVSNTQPITRLDTCQPDPRFGKYFKWSRYNTTGANVVATWFVDGSCQTVDTTKWARGVLEVEEAMCSTANMGFDQNEVSFGFNRPFFTYSGVQYPSSLDVRACTRARSKYSPAQVVKLSPAPSRAPCDALITAYDTDGCYGSVLSVMSIPKLGRCTWDPYMQVCTHMARSDVGPVWARTYEYLSLVVCALSWHTCEFRDLKAYRQAYFV
jgi:hypothetical protein